MVSEKETAAEVIEELSEVEQGVDEVSDEHTSLMKEPKKGTVALTMVLSFVMPTIIMALALYNNQIYPGGTCTVFIYDLQAQFAPVYASLRYIGQTDSSLFYSFYGALGSNSFPNLISYMLDPLSWITVLFPLKSLPDALYYITLIKIGLCGLGFSIFLLFRDKNEKRFFVILIISCCYALMSYNVMYSECLLWLNVVALTPLVLLGVDMILSGKRGILYILALLFSMCYVFQMAFMTGILAILYILYRSIHINIETVKKMFCLVGYSIISLGLYMPIFIPMIINTVNGRLKTDDSIDRELFYYPIWKAFRQLLSCQYDSLDSGGLPCIFCGTLSVLLVVIFFFKKEIEFKRKIIALLILLFYFFSFCFIPLNRMWHGFVEPHSFPCRYSYTFCCLVLVLVYETGALLYGLLTGHPHSASMFVNLVVVLFALSELYMNAAYIISSNNISESYRLRWFYDDYIEQTEAMLSHIDDKSFFRIGRDAYTYSMNDGMLFGYNGINYFSSYYSRNAMGLLGTLGYSQSEYAMSDMGATPLVETSLGVKYRFSRKTESFPSYEVLCEESPDVLCFNSSALPLGFLMGNSDEIREGATQYVDAENIGNAFVYQEMMLSDIYGKECDIYENIDYDMQEIEDDTARHVIISFTAESNKPIWIYCKPATKEEIEGNKKLEDKMIASVFDVNGEHKLAVRTKLATVCAYVGTFSEGEKVTIEASDGMYFGDPWLVYSDDDECCKILDEIGQNGLNVTYHDKGRIEGSIFVSSDDSYMMLTLPYMEGYRVNVDGVRTDYDAYRNSLMLVRLKKGEHVISVSFIPPGFVPGLIIGLISLLITLLLCFIPTRRSGKNVTDLT